MELSWFPPRIFVGRENPSIRNPANRIEADQNALVDTIAPRRSWPTTWNEFLPKCSASQIDLALRLEPIANFTTSGPTTRVAAVDSVCWVGDEKERSNWRA